MKKQSTTDKGRAAEDFARQYVVNLGYTILDTNWHIGHLELDIVALDGDQLVIIEVKSRYGIPFEHPSEAVTPAKMKRIVEAAEAYIMFKNLDMEVRFDIITVIIQGFDFDLEHFTDAFYPML